MNPPSDALAGAAHAALEHLIASGTLRVISRDLVLPELRVFTVDPD